MKTIVISGILGCLLMTQGCSSESVNRGVHDTLENIRQMDCEKERNQDCPGRESYDDYRRQRQDAVQ